MKMISIKEENHQDLKKCVLTSQRQSEEISAPAGQSPKKFEKLRSELSQQPNTKQIERVHMVIEHIKENPGKSLYDISKELSIPNSSLFYIIRDLESSHVIFTKMAIGEGNRAVRLVFYSNKQKETNTGEKSPVAAHYHSPNKKRSGNSLGLEPSFPKESERVE